MTGARWKLGRLERIETAMFAALESFGDPATTEALMAQAFIEKTLAPDPRVREHGAAREEPVQMPPSEKKATRHLLRRASLGLRTPAVA